MNRREFLIQTGAATAAYALGGALRTRAETDAPPGHRFEGSVAIVCDPTNTVVSGQPVQWAVDRLRAALAARNFIVRTCARLEEAKPEDLFPNLKTLADHA